MAPLRDPRTDSSPEGGTYPTYLRHNTRSIDSQANCNVLVFWGMSAIVPNCTDHPQPTQSVSCVFASDGFDARRRSCSQASTSQPASTALQSRQQPVFELCHSRRAGKQPEFGELLMRRPVAAVALVPQPIILFSAGAVAGALGTAHCCLNVRRGVLQALSKFRR